MSTKKSFHINSEMLLELDGLYKSRSSLGYPDCWNNLVHSLRAIRRQVEAGVEVTVEGYPMPLRTWNDFYTWAHGRYHALEEGSDEWIGNDG